jgi:hypothetical protein
VSYFCYVYVDGKAEQREVTIDQNLLQGDRVRVLTGLNAGDLLIDENVRQVGPGQTVQRKDAPSADKASSEAGDSRADAKENDA